jgi:hypothetical protein
MQFSKDIVFQKKEGRTRKGIDLRKKEKNVTGASAQGIEHHQKEANTSLNTQNRKRERKAGENMNILNKERNIKKLTMYLHKENLVTRCVVIGEERGKKLTQMILLGKIGKTNSTHIGAFVLAMIENPTE